MQWIPHECMHDTFKCLLCEGVIKDAAAALEFVYIGCHPPDEVSAWSCQGLCQLRSRVFTFRTAEEKRPFSCEELHIHTKTPSDTEFRCHEHAMYTFL